MNDGEIIMDYIIRVEIVVIVLKVVGEVISDSLLVVMVLKGFFSSYRVFVIVVM